MTHDEYIISGALRRVVVVKHYGPGPHPGTGTDQTIHGGDGAAVAGADEGIGDVAAVIETMRADKGTVFMDPVAAAALVGETWAAWLTPEGDFASETKGASHGHYANMMLKAAGIVEYADDRFAYRWMIDHGFTRVRTLMRNEIGIEAHGNIGDRSLSSMRELMRALPGHQLVVDLVVYSRYGEAYGETAAKRLENAVMRGGPGSREHFEFIVLGLEGIRGWLTRVERKGTPEPPKEAKP